MAWAEHPVRVSVRLVRLAGALTFAAADYLVAVYWKHRTLSAKARWLQRHARRILRVLSVDPRYHGSPPAKGLLVSNHLSYLDILVLGAGQPLIFISKAEVARWPVFGFLSRLSGTLFIRRDRRADVIRIASEMSEVIAAGQVLAFFPEGTSSDGHCVLPFHSALFAPAVRHQWPVTPASISYRLPEGDGSVEENVAYWGEMVFGTHLLRLLGQPRIEATIRYGIANAPTGDRAALAAHLQSCVCALKAPDAEI